MNVSINQPAYLPWLGYFDRIDASDAHIVLDDVQFEKNSFVNRNKIRTPEGWTWLTIPLATKGKFGNLPINSLRYADDGRWKRRHRAALQANYARAPYFSEHIESLQLDGAQHSEGDFFLPAVLSMNDYFLRALGAETKILRSSDIDVGASKSELVLELCRAVHATTYISGPLGRDYLDLASFESANITVLFHDYVPQPYSQSWPGFEPGMGVIDILANHDKKSSAAIMRAGRQLSPC